MTFQRWKADHESFFFRILFKYNHEPYTLNMLKNIGQVSAVYTSVTRSKIPYNIRSLRTWHIMRIVCVCKRVYMCRLTITDQLCKKRR